MSNGHLLSARAGIPQPKNSDAGGARKYGSDHAFLDGNIARRRCASIPFVWWDTEVRGFGLFTRPSGTKNWIVHYRRRGKQVRKILGRADKLNAHDARVAARAFLAQEALDGLPPSPVKKADAGTLFREFAPRFLAEYGPHWKASTFACNKVIVTELTGIFGDREIAEIRRGDVLQWRDASVAKQGKFNRSIPVLSVLMQYSEKVGLRPKGSNPCRGTPRYKRDLPDRFLSADEYRRLARALKQVEPKWPAAVAAIRLLIYTGARRGEIESLEWEWVQPPRLMLPDSKTGQKIILLNRQAQEVLDGISTRKRKGLVFPVKMTKKRGVRPIDLDRGWKEIRKLAAIPDLRLHDLRHSFASIAIADGISLMHIGSLLGHALPETTARYAHLADDTVAAAAQRVSGSIARCLGLVA